MVNQDLVSVVVCSYNNEKYVLDCLNSIFDQSYKNIELLISDDCSIDKTYDIIKEWCELNNDRFVRCYYKRNDTNIGISINFNSILKFAEGKYIKILAADDILLKDAIKLEFDYLNNNLQDQIVYANCIVISENDTYPLNSVDKKEIFYKTIPKSGYNLVSSLIKSCFIAAPTVMFRGNTFKEFGYFREDLSFEDWEYWIRLSKNGARIGYLNSIVLAYRIYVGSSSHTGFGKKGEDRFIKNSLTEEKILLENKEYWEYDTFQLFWTRVFNNIIKYNYKNAYDVFYNNIKYVHSIKVRLKLILFKLNLSKIFYRRQAE